tara:strand:+ start:194 stop:388 length:195 start_codon:yes stop_codon:yes gene_type:complete
MKFKESQLIKWYHMSADEIIVIDTGYGVILKLETYNWANNSFISYSILSEKGIHRYSENYLDKI